MLVEHRERLALVGELLADASHELNNQLAFVLSNLQNLAEYGDDLSRVVAAYRDRMNAMGAKDAALSKLETDVDLDFLLDDAGRAARDGLSGATRLRDILRVLSRLTEDEPADRPLIDLAKGAELPGRVTALRKQLAADLGIVLPSVHLRDNLRLDANAYRVLLRGLEIGKGVAHADRLMALDPSGAAPAIEGLRGQDPAFGLPAVWVLAGERARAEAVGLTLVDPPSVITTHLTELLRKNAHELEGLAAG